MFNRIKQTHQRSIRDALPTSRRNFLKLSVGAGAGLTLSMSLPAVAAESETKHLNAEGQFEPNAFVRIGEDGKVEVMMKHLEMGQGSYTGLATLIAEELDAEWDDVIAVGAPADAKRYNNLLWGPAQGTGGSSAIANSFEQLRMAGATAKAMLVAAAAQQWGVPADQISVSKGIVSHQGSGKQAGFGELAALAAQQPVPAIEDVKLKSPKDFQLIGRKVRRKDPGKSNGTATFTQDIKLDGMVTAVVAHPPRFGSKLQSYDDSKARQVKGVVNVVPTLTGVAVVAKDFWSAKKGRDALSIQWDNSAALDKSSDQIMQEYKALAANPGLVARNEGDAYSALNDAETVIEADFEFPFLAHSAMEPMNCVALVDESGCEIWNGEQMQTGDQYAISQLLQIKPEQVRLNQLLAGGSFGRRANPHSDYILESVSIAKAMPGTPVKLVWTREDDTQRGYYRPMYYHKLRGGLDKDGNLVAWQQRIVGQSILKGTAFEAFLVKDGIDATSVEGASTLPYAVPNLNVDLHTTDLQVPVQWWRSVGHTHTAFSTEVFIDQLARKAGRDPVVVRMQLLKDHPRHQGVLKLAAEKAGWGRQLPEGHAMGVAVHESFNSFVAQVAEVSLQPGGGFKVEKVVCAVDCGIAINPDVIKAQMEGGIGYGLSPALISEITLENGQPVESNFHNYQVLRLDQMPEIEVHIIPSAEPPTGVGEPGTPPIAPAVANALSALTGQTFNRLPLQLKS